VSYMSVTIRSSLKRSSSAEQQLSAEIWPCHHSHTHLYEHMYTNLTYMNTFEELNTGRSEYS
jgi:hypothetical protein